MIAFALPLRLVNETNAREHWSKRSLRAKTHRNLVKLAMGTRRPPLPCDVLITRIGPRELDDDNLAASGKHVRDGIAAVLGIDDRDPRVRWRYAQRRPGRHEASSLMGGRWGVEVQIGPLGATSCEQSV